MKNIKSFNQFSKINEEGLLYGYKTKIFYSDILSGDEATEENAYDRARGLDWMEIESKEQTIAYLNYIDTVNGVGIWYCYGDGSYYFSNETE